MRKFVAGVILGAVVSFSLPVNAWDVDNALQRMSTALVEISATLKRIDTKLGHCRQ